MGGFSRVLVSRAFSLVYVIVIAWLVAKGIMDQMIILASGQIIIVQLASFAMRFSCRQRALSVSGEESDKFRYNGVLFMLLISTPLSIIIAIVLALYVVGLGNLQLLLLYPLSMALLMIMEIELMVEKTLLAADRAQVLNMTYTVLNSVLVPIFFFFTPSLEGILLAWNVCLLLTVLLDIKAPIRILQRENIIFRQ